jgi:hypothetical protein
VPLIYRKITKQLNESDARRVMLVRSIELADTEGRVWPREARRAASVAALQDTDVRGSGTQDAYLARRAALACARLERTHPPIAAVLQRDRRAGGLLWALPLLALVLGVGASALDAQRQINIISFPLLGMLAWNAVVCAGIIAGALIGLARQRAIVQPGPLTSLLMTISSPGSITGTDEDPLRRGLRQFRFEWLRLSTPLSAARVRTALHVAAALLALGTVTGMYVRGLAFEYVAGWESTFLSEYAVHRLLRLVLGPASALTGIAIPPPEHRATLRWSGLLRGGENAAPWIHLYAVTAMLFIVVPRIVLALWTGLAALRLKRGFPLATGGDPYFRCMLSFREGHGARVRIVPYSYRPSAGTQAALRELFAEAWGERVQVELDEPVPYGGEDDYALEVSPPGTRAPDLVVGLFNSAATPEDENHGVFIERLQAAVRAAPGACALLALVDESPYRQRLLGQPELHQRLSERRLAWETLIGGRGTPFLSLELDSSDLAAAARRLEQLSLAQPALSENP